MSVDISRGASRGALSLSQKLAFARAAVFAQVAGLPAQIRFQLGRGVSESALVLAGPPPDSALARAALEQAVDVYEPGVLQHCLRCWYFGDLFAKADGHVFDPELLYVASLLHDLGLSESFRPGPAAACFAVHGGEAARGLMLGWGAQPQRADRVADMIASHMDVRVPVERGTEAFLLHAAAHLDVVGDRAGDVPRELIRQVLAAHPRGGFPSEFRSAMREESRQRPDSRAAVLWRIGMRASLALNPLERLG